MSKLGYIFNRKLIVDSSLHTKTNLNLATFHCKEATNSTGTILKFKSSLLILSRDEPRAVMLFQFQFCERVKIYQCQIFIYAKKNLTR